MKKSYDRYYFLLAVLIFISVITMLIGNVYSYYSKKSNNDTAKIYVKDVVLLMQYESGNSIYIGNIENGLDYNYYFSVVNTSSDYGVKYNLIFDKELINDKTNEGLKFYLSANTNNKSNKDKLVKLDNENILNKKMGEGYISPNQTHYYTLNIKYNGDINNDILIGKIKLQKAID